MSLALETILLPRSTYLRLRRLADRSHSEPETVIEHLLDWADQQSADVQAQPAEETSSIYQLHKYAVDMGVADLAMNIDHYLYGDLIADA